MNDKMENLKTTRGNFSRLHMQSHKIKSEEIKIVKFDIS